MGLGVAAVLDLNKLEGVDGYSDIRHWVPCNVFNTMASPICWYCVLTLVVPVLMTAESKDDEEEEYNEDPTEDVSSSSQVKIPPFKLVLSEETISF